MNQFQGELLKMKTLSNITGSSQNLQRVNAKRKPIGIVCQLFQIPARGGLNSSPDELSKLWGVVQCFRSGRLALIGGIYFVCVTVEILNLLLV